MKVAFREKIHLLTPIGCLSLCFDQQKLIKIDFECRQNKNDAIIPYYAQAVIDSLNQYFDCASYTSPIEFELIGTAFQINVWHALRQIQPGITVTYGELAKKLGSAPRAVGQAVRTNPFPILIPCHRVVAKNHVGGFAGETAGRKIAIKRWLLSHEGVAA